MSMTPILLTVSDMMMWLTESIKKIILINKFKYALIFITYTKEYINSGMHKKY